MIESATGYCQVLFKTYYCSSKRTLSLISNKFNVNVLDGHNTNEYFSMLKLLRLRPFQRQFGSFHVSPKCLYAMLGRPETVSCLGCLKPSAQIWPKWTLVRRLGQDNCQYRRGLGRLKNVVSLKFIMLDGRCTELWI